MAHHEELPISGPFALGLFNLLDDFLWVFKCGGYLDDVEVSVIIGVHRRND